jgi:arsenate reductase-like glutaredoxin family protein
MKLELSDGRIIESPSKADLESWIQKIGDGIDHLILMDGDDYIQAVGRFFKKLF